MSARRNVDGRRLLDMRSRALRCRQTARALRIGVRKLTERPNPCWWTLEGVLIDWHPPEDWLAQHFDQHFTGSLDEHHHEALPLATQVMPPGTALRLHLPAEGSRDRVTIPDTTGSDLATLAMPWVARDLANSVTWFAYITDAVVTGGHFWCRALWARPKGQPNAYTDDQVAEAVALEDERRIADLPAAETALLASQADAREIFFFYEQAASALYAARDTDPTALERAIEYMRKSIAISPDAARWQRKRYRNNEPLWNHYSYKQLSIIEERAGNAQTALDLATAARDTGWTGDDWDKRIARLHRKLTG